MKYESSHSPERLDKGEDTKSVLPADYKHLRKDNNTAESVGNPDTNV